MSPPLVKEQAKTIRDALTRIDPAGKDTYEAGFAAFSKDLDRLHERLTKLLAPLAGREFFVYHPAFGYFAETYGALSSLSTPLRKTTSRTWRLLPTPLFRPSSQRTLGSRPSSEKTGRKRCSTR
ncbi:MAG: metal ABC transporter substrate-binding protein [Deltaproteobacteria bacterium]